MLYSTEFQHICALLRGLGVLQCRPRLVQRSSEFPAGLAQRRCSLAHLRGLDRARWVGHSRDRRFALLASPAVALAARLADAVYRGMAKLERRAGDPGRRDVGAGCAARVVVA